jgi:hypothetical protein
MLEFIERNYHGLFLYKKLLEKKIEQSNNVAGIVFRLFRRAKPICSAKNMSKIPIIEVGSFF